MRQGQQQNRRGRNNSNNNNNRRNNNNNNNKPQNMLTKNFDSTGPDVKIRGNAATIAEKYMSLAHDAISAGSRIKAENYFQHAEHYKRIVSVALEQQAEQKAAHEAKQAAQRAAHAEQQAARAEQQAARAEQRAEHHAARNETQQDNDDAQTDVPFEANNEQPDLNIQPSMVDDSAPSMNNNNNMPVDILSSETPTSNSQPEVQEKPKRRPTARPKRKPVRASTTPVDTNEVATSTVSVNAETQEQVPPAENTAQDTSDKAVAVEKKPARKPRVARAKKPKVDSASSTDAPEADKKPVKKPLEKIAETATDDVTKDTA